MKVYLATSGSYSDFRVNAAFSSMELAIEASENDVIVLDVHDEALPRWRVVQLTAAVELPEHPTNWAPHMEAKHFHTGGKEECWICNPGHIEEGDCPACVVTVEEREQTWLIWPWDDPVSMVEGRTIRSSERLQSILVFGIDEGLVRKAYRDRVAQARAELEGIA